jgi:cytochrome c556
MKNLMKMGILGLAAAAAATTAVVAQPAPPTPEQQAANATVTRQAVFKLLGWNMDPMAGMLRGTVEFDAAVVQTNAHNIAGLAPMIPDLFANDTREFDVETKAQDRIWTSKADFDMKAAALAEAATAAAEAAAGGDAAATRAAIGRIGQACGSCHDDFRVD